MNNIFIQNTVNVIVFCKCNKVTTDSLNSENLKIAIATGLQIYYGIADPKVGE